MKIAARNNKSSFEMLFSSLRMLEVNEWRHNCAFCSGLFFKHPHTHTHTECSQYIQMLIYFHKLTRVLLTSEEKSGNSWKKRAHFCINCTVHPVWRWDKQKDRKIMRFVFHLMHSVKMDCFSGSLSQQSKVDCCERGRKVWENKKKLIQTRRRKK